MTLEQWHLRSDIERLLVYLDVRQPLYKKICDKIASDLSCMDEIKAVLIKKYYERMQSVHDYPIFGKIAARCMMSDFANDRMNYMNFRLYTNDKPYTIFGHTSSETPLVTRR